MLIQKEFPPQFRKRFRGHVQKYFGKTTVTKKHFAILEEFVLRGGKRIRPFFLFLNAGAFAKKKISSSLWDLAIGMELVHAGMLIHDDIIDKSPTRRGRRAMHRIVGQANAIVLGDIAWSLGFDFLMRAEFPLAIRDEVVREFMHATILVGEGQILDTEYLKEKHLTLRQLYTMYMLKTSTYSIETPLVMGGIIAQKDPSRITFYRELGRELGILFQLQDDILDSKEDKVSFLKKVRGNVVAEKKKLYTRITTLIDKSRLSPTEIAIYKEIVEFLYERTI